MPPRVLLAHGPDASETANRLAAALADVGARVHGAREGAREALDASECVVAIFDARGRDAAWLDHTVGLALARGIPLFVVAREPRGLVAQATPRPRSQRAIRELAARVHAALPATPRAAVRSLSQSSEKRWSDVVRAEVAAELAARGWTKVALAQARDEGARVFVEPLEDDVWRKRIAGERVWLRPRVAPFNPVDLLHVRERIASRAYEWWLLREGRSDAWMRRVYRGDAERISRRTKFFGQRTLSLARSTPAGQLIDRRILTQRVDRTGAIAGELAAIEAWLPLQHLPRVGEQHVGAPEVGVPLGAG